MIADVNKIFFFVLLFFGGIILVLYIAKPAPLWSCGAKFTVVKNSGLNDSEVFEKACFYEKTRTECESVDIYKKATDTFGTEDGISDCVWKFSPGKQSE
ncbi:hypothetical protein IPM62_02190 [Candidatus Woesebacteria bacterium]|nr:MAG: hypothetical protein IPM62_02190 [Candidatus Woesebacteria bacterium]